MAGVSAFHVVVMGVAGCGKSAVGRRMADSLGLRLIEGDDFHPPGNLQKMRSGLALDDADRTGWLATLGGLLAEADGGAVLTCSALKHSYRTQLRAAVPELRFVHLAIKPDESLRRVAGRADHFYPPSLVASQFEALQDPAGEAGVLSLDACAPLDDLARQAVSWLQNSPHG